MTPQFTETVLSILQKAYQKAEKSHHLEITANHLLLMFCQEAGGYFQTICEALHLNLNPLIPQLHQFINTLPTYEKESKEPTLHTSLQKMIHEAQNLADEWKDTFISSDHFFYLFWKGPLEPFSSWKTQAAIS